MDDELRLDHAARQAEQTRRVPPREGVVIPPEPVDYRAALIERAAARGHRAEAEAYFARMDRDRDQQMSQR